MKALFIILLMALSPQGFSKEPYYNDADPLEHLIYRRGKADSDFVARLDWNAEIDKIPDADNRMMAIFLLHFRQENAEMLAGVLKALDARNNIPAENLKQLALTLDQLATPVKNDYFTRTMYALIMHVLHDYPSSEHEKIGQKFIGDPDIIVQSAAVKLLAQIGGPESFKMVNEAVEKRKKDQVGFSDWIGGDMSAERDGMRERLVRLRQIPDDIAAQRISRDDAAGHLKKKAAAEVATSQLVLSGQGPVFVVSALVICGGLIWMIFKVRGR